MAEIQVLCGKCGEVLHGEKGIGAIKCTNCGHLIDLSGGDDSEAQSDADETLLADDEGFATQARSLMLPKVRMSCAECGKIFSAEAGLAGRQTNCPACNALVRVPYPGEEETDPDKAEVAAPEPPDNTGGEMHTETKRPAEESTSQDESPPAEPAAVDQAQAPQASSPPTKPSVEARPESRIETVDDPALPHKSSKRPLLMSLIVAVLLLAAILLYFLRK